MLKILSAGIGWVELTFPDDSRKLIRTSLNEQVLNEFGVQAKEGFLFNLDTGDYEPFRVDAKDVNIFSEKPTYDSEVISFANRFV